MADSGMRGRVKGLLTGPPPVPEPGGAHTDGPPPAPVPMSAPNAQRDALLVLTLAQRTADEHVASAHRQADKICADAEATADEIVRDAEAHVQDLRHQANEMLADARATAERIAREAQAHADGTRHSADETLSDARAQAEEIAKDAQAHADELKHQAERRYQDIVGSLTAKREALQQQIEALEKFDREYRSRLTGFMQGQLRALWADQPQLGPELDGADPASAAGAVPAQRRPVAPPAQSSNSKR